MEFELFPYQVEGAKWLATMGQALLADSMGLGKSGQAVTASDIVQAQSILVVCPAAVRINWGREFDRFSDHQRPQSIVLSGKDKPIHPGVTVVSYDLLAGDEKMRKWCRDQAWDVLIIDEAHYLKERTAKRTKALYGHAGKPGIAASAKRVWRLSGTPAPNYADELWTHLKSAGIYKRSYWDFLYEFCAGYQDNFGGYKITGHKNVPQLKALLAQFMLRRKKDDVMKQLPPITFSHVTVERSEVELDPYFYENWRPIGVTAFLKDLETKDKALKIALKASESGGTYSDRVKLLEGLAPTTATLRRYIGLAKLPAIMDVLERELTDDPTLKLVLFAVHAQVIEGARVKLAKFKPVTLYGGTPTDKRQRNIDKFQNDPKCRVFVGQVIAAGTGITLTAAHNVVFLESDWVPANNAQAAMRCHRIGQTKPVRVRFFSCDGSVDEDVNKVLLHKTRELAKIFD